MIATDNQMYFPWGEGGYEGWGVDFKQLDQIYNGYFLAGNQSNCQLKGISEIL